MKFATYAALIGAAATKELAVQQRRGFHNAMDRLHKFGEHVRDGAHHEFKRGEHFVHHMMKKMHHMRDEIEQPHDQKKFGQHLKAKHEEVHGLHASHMEELGFKSINIAALLACIGDEDKAALIADEAIQTLEDAYKTKNIEEAVGGAIAIYAAYQQAVQGIPACAAIPHSAFEKKLAEPMTEEKDKKIAEMLQGFLKGANVGTFNFTALLECIYEADQAAEVLYVATSQIIPEAIKDKDIVEGIAGAIFLYSGVETFLTQALPLCEQVDKQGNWDNFNKKPDFTKWTHTELDGAYDSLAAGNVESFGEQLGALSAVKAETFLF